VKVRTKNGSYQYAEYTYTLKYIDINGQQHSSSYSLPYKNVPMPILLAEPTETIPIYINKWFADEYSLKKSNFSWGFLFGLVAVVIVLFGVIFLIGNIIYSILDYKNIKDE
jgi:ABC-type phosphate transport system permease subunit